MKLSICIPTFERWRFLRWTLKRIISDFPSSELVISDNHSTDGSDACADDWAIGRATMLHQPQNIGAFPNMLAALSAATGEYAVYCADDDYLLPDQIEAGIAYLDAHPECAAYCAPCEVYDEVNKKSFRNAFKVKEPCIFDLSRRISNAVSMQQMHKQTQSNEKDPSGLASEVLLQGVLREVSKGKPAPPQRIESGSANQGECQDLRKCVPKTRENSETTLPSMRPQRSSEASSGLQQAFNGGMAVPGSSSEITCGTELDLFNFIMMQHIWPEHIIYRTPVPLKPRTRAYWAFADLVDILERGSIYFTDSAFYRNLVTHPVGEREQLGNIQALSYFDEYRGGLEVLAHGLFGSELPYSARHQLQEMIASFICTRMHTAARMYVGQGKTEEAVMLLQRLSIADPRRDEVKLAARNSEGRACQ